MSLNGFQRTIVMMILLSRVIHSRQDFLPISTDRAAVAPTGPIDDVSASGRRASGDLVEGRVRHLIRLHPRRALDHLLQRLEDGGIRATRVPLCVFFQIPHADANRVCSARGDERDFVLEALLLPKHRNDVLVEELGERWRVPRLELEGNTACKYVNLLGWRGPRGETR